jgi:hypothetical protein
MDLRSVNAPVPTATVFRPAAVLDGVARDLRYAVRSFLRARRSC